MMYSRDSKCFSLIYLLNWIDRRFISIYVSFFFQAEDGIRDLVRSRGLGDVYKRQEVARCTVQSFFRVLAHPVSDGVALRFGHQAIDVDLSLIHI